MSSFTKIFAFVLVVFNSLGVQSEGVSSRDSPSTIVEDKPVAVTLLSRLSTKQKVGQVFILSYLGHSFKNSTKDILKSIQPGGLIAFKRNIKTPYQLAKFNHLAQKESFQQTGLPLFLMVDQEGGSVSRINSRPFSPSALALGETGNHELAFEAGNITGQLLSSLGFNMNLAPVVDLSDPFEKNFMATRSFGADPVLVEQMGRHFSRGLYDLKILPTLKHYPGHGGIMGDSHKGLPAKSVTRQELIDHDLTPFKNMVNSEIPSAVMVAHLSFPNVDPSGLPATYSSVLINDILKKQIGYTGLVITDDLEMAGAAHIRSLGERVVKAFNAGNDMIMIGSGPRRQRLAFQGLLAAVESGRISEQRLNESVSKIIDYKLRVSGLRLKPPPVSKQIYLGLKDHMRKISELSNRVARLNLGRSARGYSFYQNSIKPDQDIIVFTSDSRFYHAMKSSMPNSMRMYRLSRKKQNLVSEVLDRFPNSLAAYYVTGTGTASILLNVKKEHRGRLLVVNSHQPGMIPNTADYYAVFNMYSRNYNSGRWLGHFLKERTNQIARRAPAAVKKTPAN